MNWFVCSQLLIASLLLSSCKVVTPMTHNALGQFSSTVDIGSPKLKGAVAYDHKQGIYTITGGGYNIWFERDEFRYLYNEIEGDFKLTANMELIGAGVDPHRKVGWMLRTSLDDGAIHFSAVIHGDGLTLLQWRPEQDIKMKDPDNELRIESTNNITVQLERKGNQITMRTAPLGQALQVVGTQRLDHLPVTALAGLFVCSHNPDVLESAKVWGVKIEANTER